MRLESRQTARGVGDWRGGVSKKERTHGQQGGDYKGSGGWKEVEEGIG